MAQTSILQKVGPNTPMGNLMREYWVPACLSNELEAGGSPLRLMLLGEKLVAWRTPENDVGIMPHHCPHRRVSLFLGRNEPGGLRCILHGWKFDTQGRCIDMPNVPAEYDCKHKVPVKAYKVQERNGIVWCYMGTKEQVPPLPHIEPNLLPFEEVNITLVHVRANWLQAVEGALDNSHFGFLHCGHLDPDMVPDGHPLQYIADDKTPKFEILTNPWGTTYGAYRDIDKDCRYWRCTHFHFPFWTPVPQGKFFENWNNRAWVPIDDENSMMWFIRHRSWAGQSQPLKDGLPLGGLAKTKHEFLPNTSDWMGRFRLQHNESNDWHMDREAQRTNRIWCGIDNLQLQDWAVMESMGAMVDHDQEYLTYSDKMILKTRNEILRVLEEYQKTGYAPLAADSWNLENMRAGYFFTDTHTGLAEGYSQQLDLMTRIK